MSDPNPEFEALARLDDIDLDTLEREEAAALLEEADDELEQMREEIDRALERAEQAKDHDPAELAQTLDRLDNLRRVVDEYDSELRAAAEGERVDEDVHETVSRLVDELSGLSDAGEQRSEE